MLTNKFTDIMLDIETLNTTPKSVVLSIGGVAFNRHDKDVDYHFLDLRCGTKELRNEQMMMGRTISRSTMAFWKRQSAAAKKLVFQNPSVDSTFELLEKLSDFVTRHEDVKAIWANGAAFDPVILGDLYRDFDMTAPWSYRHEYCYRTFRMLHGHLVDELDFVGTQHHALADALHQAKHLQNMTHHVSMLNL